MGDKWLSINYNAHCASAGNTSDCGLIRLIGQTRYYSNDEPNQPMCVCVCANRAHTKKCWNSLDTNRRQIDERTTISRGWDLCWKHMRLLTDSTGYDVHLVWIPNERGALDPCRNALTNLPFLAAIARREFGNSHKWLTSYVCGRFHRVLYKWPQYSPLALVCQTN